MEVTPELHYPLTVDGYRVVYKGYLADPDLQDARARWPFVAIWDNHEFSWQGRQSKAQGDPQPGETVKVAAEDQAWFGPCRACEGAQRNRSSTVRRGGGEECLENWTTAASGSNPTI